MPISATKRPSQKPSRYCLDPTDCWPCWDCLQGVDIVSAAMGSPIIPHDSAAHMGWSASVRYASNSLWTHFRMYCCSDGFVAEVVEDHLSKWKTGGPRYVQTARPQLQQTHIHTPSQRSISCSRRKSIAFYCCIICSPARPRKGGWKEEQNLESVILQLSPHYLLRLTLGPPTLDQSA